MSQTDPSSGRYRPLIPDADIRSAARRVAGGESLRVVARDIGYSGSSGHRALKRRLDAMAVRAERDATLRRDSRAVAKQQPETAQGNRPEHLDGQPVIIQSDLDRSVAQARAAQAQRAAERERREADEVSPEEYRAQLYERFEIESGRKTRKEVLAARAAGRRPFRLEPSHLSEPSGGGGILSQRTLLAMAVRVGRT